MSAAAGPSPDGAGATADAGESPTVWTVSEIVGATRELLEEIFPEVLVRGEVSNFRAPVSGHWYFALKDDAAVLSVAMFARENAAVPFEVEEGMELVAGGRLTVYDRRGQFQMIARTLEPVGWGALQLAFEQLKEKLQAEGLFDPERKRPLPLLPRCVGVVTSSTGAAWRDMCRVWRRNEVPIRAILAPARVQGDEAASEIAAAIRRLNRHGEADVLIVGRGGGSREDLWAFNEEVVARAVAASGIPVVSAVGHETDQTITDFVADHRAATPTAAAEAVAVSRERLGRRIRGARRQADGAIAGMLSRARARLNDPRLQRRLRQPEGLLAVYRQRLDDAFAAATRPVEARVRVARQRLDVGGRRLIRAGVAPLALRRRHRVDDAASHIRAAIRERLRRARARLGQVAARVDALSPLAVLGRGYSICETADGTILRAASEVRVGDRVRVRLARGEMDCSVDDTRDTGAAGSLTDSGPAAPDPG